MACPRAEVLSQWVDATIDARDAAPVARHVEACGACAAKAAELRAAGAWISEVAEAGPACLSADEMAAALDGGRIPPHVRTCSRCASEFRALRPEKGTKRATRRRERPRMSLQPWVAAAAVFIAVAVLFLFALNQSPSPNVEFAYRPPTPIAQDSSKPAIPVAPVAPKAPTATPDPATPPASVPLRPDPAPARSTDEKPPVSAPAPEARQAESPAAPVREPLKEIVERRPARVAAALTVKSGSLTALTVDGKWVKPGRVEEGMTLRADGKSTIEFAQARVVLDRDSRFSVNKEEFALLEGSLAAEVSPGGPFILVLDEQRFFPQTQAARVLLCAKPAALLVEEGAAKWRETFLREGTEYAVRKDSVEAKKTRSLANSARGREQLTWRLDLSNSSVARKNVVGRVDNSPEGRMLVSEPMEGSGYYARLIYNNGGEVQPVFTVKPNTAIRIHYYLREPGHLELVMWNGTKGENFNKVLEPVVRQWTTVTIYAREVAANRGGKPVTCEVGDKYTSVGLFVGLAGMPSEVHVDRLEILEIDR